MWITVILLILGILAATVAGVVAGFLISVSMISKITRGNTMEH